jgi:hypothetical protein
LISVRVDMRKVSDYKLIVFNDHNEVQKDTNAFLQQGYELYGPPFGSKDCYGQAVVKYEQAVLGQMPSTLE